MRRTGIIIIVLVVLAGLGWWRLYNPESKETQQPPPEITLLNPTGPTVVPAAGLAAQKVETPATVRVKYWKDTDEVIAAFSSGTSSFAVLPITTAANIHAKGIELVLLGVHEWNVFYMVSASQNDYKDLNSLKGKKVYTPNGRGTTLDILLRSALADEGLDPDSDVSIVYAPPQEIVALFKTGKIEYAALPEPFVTMAVAEEKGKIVFDFQEYWGELSNGTERIPIAGLFVKKEFYSSYPEISAQIAASFAESTEWGNNNLTQVAELTADVLPLSPQVLQESMQRTEFHYIPIKDCQTEVELFLSKMQELYEPGLRELPGKEFYQL